MRKRRGFTLMELLVVVAIIAILVAIAVPAFSASLERSREAACTANRRSLKGLLSVAWMTEGREGYDREVGHLDEYTCPSGGVLTPALDETVGLVTVTCSIHAPASTLGNADTLSKVLEIIESNRGSSGTIDSEAIADGTSFSSAISQALRDAELNLTDMDAHLWQYRTYTTQKQFFYWTSVPPERLSPGDSVPVLRYNTESGSYTVWLAPVVEQTRSGGDGSKYLALSQTINTQLYSGQGPETYENAANWLQEALKNYGYSDG